MYIRPRRRAAREAFFPAAVLALVACGGDRARTTAPPPGDPEAVFGPLEVGADLTGFVKLTPTPFLSTAHGARWVDVYVSAGGAAAYEGHGDIPVGTVLVKPSWVDAGGAPSAVAGPIFVMQKRAPGYDPAHGDWWYAIHWANPPAADAARFGGPMYWRGHSPRVQYCVDCHDDYDRGLGGLIPSSILQR